MNTRLTLCALLVVGAAVGAWVIKPEYDLHAALQPSTEPEPAHPSIVMLGDSHTYIANWRRLMDCPSIANFGIGGNTSAQVLERLPAVIAARPKIVFFLIGTNDAIGSVPPEQTVAHVDEVRSRLAASGIRTVVVSPPLLADGRAFAPVKSDVAVNFDKSDLLADGVHLRRSGYAKWRDAIAPLVQEHCKAG